MRSKTMSSPAMTHAVVVGASVAGVLAMSVGCSSAPSVSGRVVDALTDAPREGVEVRIAGTAVSATTDASGAFQILDVAPGQHELELGTDGVVAESLPTFTVGEGQQLPLADIVVLSVPDRDGLFVDSVSGSGVVRLPDAPSSWEVFKGNVIAAEKGMSGITDFANVYGGSHIAIVVRADSGDTEEAPLLEVTPIEFVAAGRRSQRLGFARYRDTWPDYYRPTAEPSRHSGGRFGDAVVKYKVSLDVGHHRVCHRVRTEPLHWSCGTVHAEEPPFEVPEVRFGDLAIPLGEPASPDLMERFVEDTPASPPDGTTMCTDTGFYSRRVCVDGSTLENVAIQVPYGCTDDADWRRTVSGNLTLAGASQEEVREAIRGVKQGSRIEQVGEYGGSAMHTWSGPGYVARLSASFNDGEMRECTFMISKAASDDAP